MVRAKSSLILVGLLLILLPVLAVLQYRWIGEVSTAERDRLESSLRIASERFAIEFDTEFSRLANAFQIRYGVPESAAPIVDKYQPWSETSAYPRIVHAIYLLKTTPDTQSEYYRVDLSARELRSAAMPKALENVRDRFRPGPFSYSAGDAVMLVI